MGHEINEYENESRTFAWILLSVSEGGSSIADILALADGINRAIPTRLELHMSLGWLRTQGLVRKDGWRYVRTEAGSGVVQRVGGGSGTMMTGTVHLLARELQKMVDASSAVDDITSDKVVSGYEAHKRKFSELYKDAKGTREA